MIYMLEDDGGIRNFVLYALNNTGFEAEGFECPSEFYKAMNEKIPELLLLDIMLPEEDGISILKKLRADERTCRLPVIMLTAKDTEFDTVTGLDSGADDYISKPFGTMELISRIKALLRRTAGSGSDNILSAGGITIDTQRREVKVDGEYVPLTFKEYEVLVLLLRNAGKVFSRDELLQKVWGFDFTGESRTVDVHMRTLRAKLGDRSRHIVTIRGIGYKFSKE